MQRILITGVGGFIGGAFAKWVREHSPETEIYGVDDGSGCTLFDYEDATRLCPGLRALTDFAEYSLGGAYEGKGWGWPISMCEVAEEARWPQMDAVYHFAAYAAECLSPFIRRYNYRNNVEGTADVVNYCINSGAGKLVFASSAAVYGNAADGSACPIDPYGVAKYASELDIQIAGHQHGLKHDIVRLYNVYGPGQNLADRYRNVLGIWMREAYHGRPITVFGDGTQRRKFTYIQDILPGLWELGKPRRAPWHYDLGATRDYCLRYVADRLSELTGAPIVHQDARHEAHSPHVRPYLAQQSGWFEHETDLKVGMQKMWEWAKEVLPKIDTTPRKMNLEVTKGLYSQWK